MGLWNCSKFVYQNAITFYIEIYSYLINSFSLASVIRKNMQAAFHMN